MKRGPLKMPILRLQQDCISFWRVYHLALDKAKPAVWAEAIQTFGTSIWEGLFIIFNVLLFKSLRKS